MVERSLSMREVRGSIPRISTLFLSNFFLSLLVIRVILVNMRFFLDRFFG